MSRQISAIRDSLGQRFWHGLRFTVPKSDAFPGGTAMGNQDFKWLPASVALALLGGSVAGVVADFPLAPRSGEETRRILKGYARKAEGKVADQGPGVRCSI